MTHSIQGTALITGASGFIGTRLRDALLDAGVDVVTLRRRESKEPKRGRSVVGDYPDVDGLARTLAEVEPDYVFHVAGVTKGRAIEDFRAGNVLPTQSMIAAVRKSGATLKRFVHVSSLAAYGSAKAGAPKRESHERTPVEDYGRSKHEAELVVEAVMDIPWTIIRPAGVYGPGDYDYLELFKLASRGLNVFYGNRHRWFSGVYVDDVVNAIIASATSEKTVGKGYFICDGVPITWDTYQAEVLRALDRKALTLLLPEIVTWIAAYAGDLATRIDKKPRLFSKNRAIMGAQEAWTCQHDAAREDFGYVPTVSLEEGVRRTLAWYRAEGLVR